jgi:Zn-dependent peptidase ImmA (M78 family)
MCNYEKLLHDASMIGLEVKEIQFESDAKGLCKGQKIGIRKDLSDAEKACVLAEEIGHYYTTVGNILNQKNTENRKQEIKARKWAVDKILTIEDVFEATEHPCSNLFEIAEYLEVTEEFLLEALEIFKKRYGHSYTYKGKTIIFCDYGFCIK